MGGTVQWTVDGVIVSAAAYTQANPEIVSDGAGGAIVAWNDKRSSGVEIDIYAQRLDSSGVVQWTPDDVALCTAADYQSIYASIADGAGGAIVMWSDPRSGLDLDIYAQRVTHLGVVGEFPVPVPVMAIPAIALLTASLCLKRLGKQSAS
jgi:hypothetical protein